MRLPALLPALLIAQSLSAQQGSSRQAIESARAGGAVILCRHGATDNFDENERTLRYNDPATQRKLNQKGEQQSEELGRALRALGVSAGEVIASPMQRAHKTAELMFDRVTLDSLWHTRGDDYGERKRERLAILARAAPSGNRVIVSHVGTIGSLFDLRGGMQEGDCAVLRPTRDSFEVIGIVPWRHWIEAASKRN